MLNVTWERKDLSFNNQGFLSHPPMVVIALDRERIWDKVAAPLAQERGGFIRHFGKKKRRGPSEDQRKRASFFKLLFELDIQSYLSNRYL